MTKNTARTPAREGWTTFAEGAAAALAELPAALGRGRDAVVVTSGGILAALCSTLLCLRAERVVALNRVTVNASVTTLAVGTSGTTLLTFNEHAHFAGDQRHLLTYR
ncbi:MULTISPECIES: histidine phosphatase family protein [unclassified Streptomyces]|uniref:histidine phosphatase family protein n=1 Tax=unclassified Streptomyces TaxID=2593676 RepID=UPI002E362C66|nr:histidine phosphatase family protein [Streptomyces sp. NBC_01280]WSE11987.1 histidine phosphatase family protein [Streptomyces sp. NBC_01397]WSE19639.1 histidine phosphatase family protein [Streptomyces sp. NBC_01397]